METLGSLLFLSYLLSLVMADVQEVSKALAFSNGCQGAAPYPAWSDVPLSGQVPAWGADGGQPADKTLHHQLYVGRYLALGVESVSRLHHQLQTWTPPTSWGQYVSLHKISTDYTLKTSSAILSR